MSVKIEWREVAWALYVLRCVYKDSGEYAGKRLARMCGMQHVLNNRKNFCLVGEETARTIRELADLRHNPNMVTVVKAKEA